MRLDEVALRAPTRPAVVHTPTGARTTYAQLDERSRRLAAALRARGLAPGDSIAVLMDNRPAYFAAAWAAQRSGLSWTPVNWHLTEREVCFIVQDCGARALVTTTALADLAAAVAERVPLDVRVMEGGPAAGFEDYGELVDRASEGPLHLQLEGSVMYYSSGTTGVPKGVRRPWPRAPYGTGVSLDVVQADRFGFGEDTVYLCPAPLYHAAPMSWSMGALRLGGTVVLMDRFDAREVLALIERYRITHVQMVPTMFIRLLRLPADVRASFDLSSLRMAIHAAAPCPVAIKEEMLEWWGEIVHEYYAGTEANGFCTIGPVEWRAHPGSVGRPLGGVVHVVDDGGRDLPAGEVGRVYFEGTSRFEYHGRPAETAAAFDARGWSTLGDVGYLDAEGYLYLTDRASNMIVSGGVNVYPQEVENVLAPHPAVADVAVVGVPDEDMGEVVKALVVPVTRDRAGPALSAELLGYCREHLAHVKCPRTIDFVDELPRLESGKLARRALPDLW